MPVYTHPNGLDYTEEQIQAAADKAEVSIDDYIKEKKLAPKKVKAKPIEQKSAFPTTPELDILGVEKMKAATPRKKDAILDNIKKLDKGSITIGPIEREYEPVVIEKGSVGDYLTSSLRTEKANKTAFAMEEEEGSEFLKKLYAGIPNLTFEETTSLGGDISNVFDAVKAVYTDPTTGKKIESDVLQFDVGVLNANAKERPEIANKNADILKDFFNKNIKAKDLSKNKYLQDITKLNYNKQVAKAITPEFQAQVDEEFDNPDLFVPKKEQKVSMAATGQIAMGGAGYTTTIIKPYEKELRESKLRILKRNPNISKEELGLETERLTRDLLKNRAITDKKADVAEKIIENDPSMQSSLYVGSLLANKQAVDTQNKSTTKLKIAENKAININNLAVDCADIFKGVPKSDTELTAIVRKFANVGITFDPLDSEIVTLKNGQQVNKGFLNAYNKLEEQYKLNSSYAINAFKEQNENLKKLEDSDIFSTAAAKNYDLSEKYLTTVGTGLSDLAVGGAYFTGKVLDVLTPFTYAGDEVSKMIYGKDAETASERMDKWAVNYTNAVTDIRNSYTRDVSFEDAFDNGSNFGKFAAQELTSQIPIITAMVLSGGAATAMVGVTSAGSKMADMQTEMAAGEANYSKTELWLKSIGYGGAEAGFSALTTIPILKRAKVSLGRAGGPDVIDNSMKAYFKSKTPGFVFDQFLESAGEVGTTMTQNLIDGRPVMENAAHAGFSGFGMGMVMSGTPYTKGLYLSAFSDYNSKNEIRTLGKELNELGKKFELATSTEEKKALGSLMEKKEIEQNTAIEKQQKLINNTLRAGVAEAIISIEGKKASLQNEAKEILDDKNISTENKDLIIEDLRVEFNKLEAIKQDALSPSSMSSDVSRFKLLKYSKPDRYDDLLEQAAEGVGLEGDIKPSTEKIQKAAFDLYLKQEIDININNASKVEGARIKAFETKNEAIEYIKTKSGLSEIDQKTAIDGIREGADGFNNDTTGQILVKENMLSNGRSQIATHEVGHYAANLLLKSNPKAFTPIAKQLLLTTKKLDKNLYKQLVNSTERNENGDLKATEVISRFLELVSKGDITFAEKSKKYKGLAGLFGSMVQKTHPDITAFDFKGENDMYNFVVGLGKKISTGTLTLSDIESGKKSGAIKLAELESMTKEYSGIASGIDAGVEFSKVDELKKELANLEVEYDEGYGDMEEADYKAQKGNIERKLQIEIKKAPQETPKTEKPKESIKEKVSEEEAEDVKIIENNKGAVASNKVQQIYDEKGIEGAFDIIKQFGPITSKLVDKRRDAPGFDKQLLTDELETGSGGLYDLIKSYDPKAGVPLAAYINKYLPMRAIAASKRILSEKFSKEIMDDSGSPAYDMEDDYSFDSTLDEIRDEEDRQANLINPIDMMGAELGQEYNASVKEKIDAMTASELGSLTFAKLNDLAPEVTAKFFGTTVRKVTDAKANLATPEIPVIQKIIYDNRTKLIKLLPEGAILEGMPASDILIGTGLSIPRKLQQLFYDQKERLGKGAGLIPFQLKKNITQEEFLNAFGINKDGSFEPFGGQDPRSQTILAMIRLYGKIASNTAVRMEAVQTLEQAADLKAGASLIQFSEGIKKQAIIDGDFNFSGSSETMNTDTNTYRGLLDNVMGIFGIESPMPLANNAVGYQNFDNEALSSYIKSREGLLKMLPIELTFDKGLLAGLRASQYRTDSSGVDWVKNLFKKVISKEGNILAPDSPEVISIKKSLSADNINSLLAKGNSELDLSDTSKGIIKKINTLEKALGKDGKYTSINPTKQTNVKNTILIDPNNSSSIEKAGKELSKFNEINKLKAELFFNITKEWVNENGISKTERNTRIGTVYTMFAGNNNIASGIRSLSAMVGIVVDKKNKEGNILRKLPRNKKGNLTPTAIRTIDKFLNTLPEVEKQERLNKVTNKYKYKTDKKGNLILENGKKIENNKNEYYEKLLIEPEYTVEHEDAMINIMPRVLEEIINNKDYIEFNSTSKLVPLSLAKIRNKDVASKLSDASTYNLLLDKEVKSSKGRYEIIPLTKVADVSGIQFSKALSTEFNKILEETRGIGVNEQFSDITARTIGAGKGKFRVFMSPSAEDFAGLLYDFMGKGTRGEEQKKFFEDNLLKPYAAGVTRINNIRANIKQGYRDLKKEHPVEAKKLTKIIEGTTNTYDQAVRVYLWDTNGVEIPGLSRPEIDKLVDVIKNDPAFTDFANKLSAASGQLEGWIKPTEYWNVESIVSDLHNVTEKGGRKQILGEFVENADAIFSPENLNKIEAARGTDFRGALEDSLFRMKNGTNRSSGDKIGSAWASWVNNSSGAIMFLNTRSAVLQLVASTNFINWSDNNPAMAAKAFANQPQYWKDFSELWNSNSLKERRAGLKSDVDQAELANAVEGSKNKVKAALAYLLKVGYTPTQMADSFAICSGGATFYRNRINTYEKQGMSASDAKDAAYKDFLATSEESQQSADPSKISQQQASSIGRLILAFGNTPMQYNRLMKKAGRDLINGRGDAKTHISKILYYGFIQSMIFSSLQSALFAVAFEEEPEDEKEKAKQKEKAGKKYISIANSMLDTILRGTGIYGAVVSTVKNTILEYLKQEEKGFKGESAKIIIAAAGISPPISSKMSKLNSAWNTSKYDKDIIKERGFSLMQDGKFNPSPAYDIAGKVTAATTNFPLDRLVDKANNVAEMLDERNKTWQKLALGLGWKPYDVGVVNEEEDRIKAEAKTTKKFESDVKSAEDRIAKKEALANRIDKMTDEQMNEYIDSLATAKEKAAVKKEMIWDRVEKNKNQ